MKCERCNVEMEKEKIYFHIGYGEEKKIPGGGGYQKPINANSIYTCPKCGKIELNKNK